MNAHFDLYPVIPLSISYFIILSLSDLQKIGWKIDLMISENRCVLFLLDLNTIDLEVCDRYSSEIKEELFSRGFSKGNVDNNSSEVVFTYLIKITKFYPWGDKDSHCMKLRRHSLLSFQHQLFAHRHLTRSQHQKQSYLLIVNLIITNHEFI